MAKWVRRWALVAAIVAFSLVPSISPAAASGGHWVLYGGWGQAYSFWPSSMEIRYCDIAYDGRIVKIHTYSSAFGIIESNYPNAPSGGCRNVAPNGAYGYFRVCVEGIGCTSWHSRYT